jgi:hypothetical protein
MKIKYILLVALAALALSLASIGVTAPAIAGGHSTSGDFSARLGTRTVAAPEGAIAGAKPGVAGGDNRAIAGSKPGIAGGDNRAIAGSKPGIASGSNSAIAGGRGDLSGDV